MIDGSSMSRAAEVINKAASLCICLPLNPGIDTLASGLSLYLSLTKQGKNVTLACTSDIAESVNLIGVDKIQKTFTTGGDNLVISFPYKDGAIDKVTYNIEGNNFNLLIVPKTTEGKIKPSQIKYTYSGGKVDVIITLDAPSLDALGQIYSENGEQFKAVEIINIDRHINNTNFGTVHILEKQLSSTSEIVLRLFQSLNAEVDRDIATNLYAGILTATNNFTSYSVSDSTFEACAFLLKQGAVKRLVTTPKQVEVTSPKTSEVVAPAVESVAATDTINVKPEETFKTEQTFGSQFFVESDSSPETPSYSESPSQIEAKKIEKKEPKEETPKDWLKPKIFKGRSLI